VILELITIFVRDGFVPKTADPNSNTLSGISKLPKEEQELKT
jgi:hypothetical protein